MGAELGQRRQPPHRLRRDDPRLQGAQADPLQALYPMNLLHQLHQPAAAVVCGLPFSFTRPVVCSRFLPEGPLVPRHLPGAPAQKNGFLSGSRPSGAPGLPPGL